MVADSNKPKYPPGFRFVPKDEELIVHYLQLKINNQPIPIQDIIEVDLYSTNPNILSEEFPSLGEDEWYFFTPRDRKYPKGSRPKRYAINGYWKTIASDKKIRFEGRVVGYKMRLDFYEGPPQKGIKTHWKMHEYRVDMPPRTKTNASDMKLDDWVLCKIYKKAPKENKKSGGVDPTVDNVLVSSSDNPITSLQGFEEQVGFEEQFGFEEPLISPLVAPIEYHYSNNDDDTQLVDHNNIGGVAIYKHELVEDGISDSLLADYSWCNNLGPMTINENGYDNGSYGIQQQSYWPLCQNDDVDWASLGTCLSHEINNGPTISSGSSSVGNYGSYYLENFQVSSSVPPLLGSLDHSSMKSEVLMDPDYNQLLPRKRHHI